MRVFCPIQCLSHQWVSKHTKKATSSLCFPPSFSTTVKTANLTFMKKKKKSCEFIRRRMGGGVQAKTPNTARPVIKSQQLTALPASAGAMGQYIPLTPVFSIADPQCGISRSANESTDISYSILSSPNPLRAIS